MPGESDRQGDAAGAPLEVVERRFKESRVVGLNAVLVPVADRVISAIPVSGAVRVLSSIPVSGAVRVLSAIPVSRAVRVPIAAPVPAKA